MKTGIRPELESIYKETSALYIFIEIYTIVYNNHALQMIFEYCITVFKYHLQKYFNLAIYFIIIDNEF